MRETKMNYTNRFFLSEDKEDVSFIACAVTVQASCDCEYPSAAFEANLAIFDGYKDMSISAYAYSSDDDDVADFIRKLYSIRDVCNTMIAKCEEAKALHEEFQAQISKE